MSRNKSDSVSKLNKILPVPIELHNGEEIESSNPHSNHPNNHNNKLSHITDVIVGENHSITGESGSPYMVWSIKITLDDSIYSSILIYKRYREIHKLRHDLADYFKDDPGVMIPPLPPKDSLSLDRLFESKNWLEERRKGLQWFMSNVLLDPVFQGCPIVKEFMLK